MRHTDWEQLEEPARLAIEARMGRVHAARTADAGLNSQLAVVLDTEAGTVFVKGLRVDHPGVVRQGREAMINPFVRAVAPRLLWHDQAAGWDVLAFEYVDGVRHADYRPGSPDLPRVIDAMHRLSAIGCPDLPVKQARQRWAAYIDREADLELLDGDALLHTDFSPLNILLGPDRTWIIDWAWPTRGAAFIDAACFLIRAMAAGHSASQAEALASLCPGWQQASAAAIDVFALASARLYDEIARGDPQPFKQCLASIARAWVRYRDAKPRSYGSEAMRSLHLKSRWVATSTAGSGRPLARWSYEHRWPAGLRGSPRRPCLAFGMTGQITVRGRKRSLTGTREGGSVVSRSSSRLPR